MDRWKPKELIEHFVYDRVKSGYNKAIALLQRLSGNPHKLLSSYRKEFKRPEDPAAIRKLFNFFINCQEC